MRSLPKAQVAKIIKIAHEIALGQAQEIKMNAIKAMEESLTVEEERLKNLRKINPIVREDEILAIENRINTLRDCYLKADVSLDSIRIIF